MIVLFPFAFALVGAEPAKPATPDTAVVSYTIAPGEVGSPVETVTVARRGAERTITLTHKGFKASPRTETLPLKPEEFDTLWAIVTRDKLLDFTPEEEPGQAFDYGDQVLHTETRETPGDPPRVRESRWTRPLKNEARLSPLVLALAGLARSHAKTVAIELFTP